MGDSFHQIRAAVIEGRAQSPRYIQRQLTLLHDALLKHQKAIRTAIKRQTNYTSAEIDAEIYLTLDAIKHDYESFDFSKVVQEEYSLAQLKDYPSRRVAVGCIYVIPSEHSRLYSIVQTVSAAITAGNCVVVELGKSASDLDSLLAKVLAGALDGETFAMVAGKPDDQDFFTQHCVVVDARKNPQTPGSAHILLAKPSRCIAVVDRTVSSADIAHAAREIARARFSFDGKSPYAPDLVLVNEFVLQEFCRAAVQYTTTLLTRGVEPDLDDDRRAMRTAIDFVDPAVMELQRAPGVSTVLSGSRGKILCMQKRDESLMSRKVTSPVLVIHSIRSLDDAIDLINSCNRNERHQAAYFFANAVTAKYLGQFIPSRLSYTNCIPIALLVGPSAPTSCTEPPSIQPRYTQQLFSNASPEYISSRLEQDLLCDLLDSSSNVSRRKIEVESSKPLTPTKQGSGAGIGFFEQGLIVGGMVALTGVITASTLLAKYAVPVLLKQLKR